MSVIYLMSGPGHLPYLLVSLKTLREHYSGPVFVYAYPESEDIVRQIGQDRNLKIHTSTWVPTYRGKNGQFINKILLMQSHGGRNVYLDADTIIRGSLSPLFDAAKEIDFVATQFNNWTTTGGIIRRRIQRLIDREPIDQKCVWNVLGENWPSINGGVFAAYNSSKVLETWYEWTLAVKDIFIADETVLHAVMAKFVPLGMFDEMLGGVFNCSPRHSPFNGNEESQVAIWHGHGDGFLRPNKSPKGYQMWTQEFETCVAGNVGNVQNWMDQIAYSYFDKYRSARNAAISVS